MMLFVIENKLKIGAHVMKVPQVFKICYKWKAHEYVLFFLSFFYLCPPFFLAFLLSFLLPPLFFVLQSLLSFSFFLPSFLPPHISSFIFLFFPYLPILPIITPEHCNCALLHIHSTDEINNGIMLMLNELLYNYNTFIHQKARNQAAGSCLKTHYSC